MPLQRSRRPAKRATPLRSALARGRREREQEQRWLKRRIEYLTLGQKITRTGSWA